MAGLLILALLVVTTVFVPVREIAVDLIGQIRSYGPIAPIVYIVIFVIAAMTGLSRSVLTIIAGIIFEPLTAFLVVLVSSMTAFMATFIVARYLLADWVSRRLEQMPLAQKCITAVEENGFKMLVMMRLNPFIPGFINGYGFGMTSITPGRYFVASLVGSVPLMVSYIGLGWVGGKALLLGGPEAETLETGTLIFGGLISIATLVVIGWYARRALTRTLR